MGWSIGYDGNLSRDIGYGVPCECDHPKCNKEIDRGLSHVCGSEPYGGDFGCGLYFCAEHFDFRKPRGSDQTIQLCPRCYEYRKPFTPKPDIAEWINHKLTDESWQLWREENPGEVKELQAKVS